MADFALFSVALRPTDDVIGKITRKRMKRACCALQARLRVPSTYMSLAGAI
jgi:hypothetical protein